MTVLPLLDESYLRIIYSGRGKSLSIALGASFRRIRDVLQCRRYDLVWMEKELLPWMPAWGETLLNFFRIPYVVDYDDAVFHHYDLNKRRIIRRLLGRKIDTVMRHSAMVMVGNDYLAERAHKAGAKRVEYLPTVVDLERYPATFLPDNAVFTLGWIGTPHTARYVPLIHEALSHVCRAGSARVILVGSGPLTLDGVPIETHSWSEATETAELQHFDAGIMPLADNPWEWGKCGYKLIQYMACSRPVVASPVGVNCRIVEHGVNGLLASTPQDWENALTTLRDDASLRKQMGREGRRKVEQEYCLQVTGPKLLNLLRSAAD